MLILFLSLSMTLWFALSNKPQYTLARLNTIPMPVQFDSTEIDMEAIDQVHATALPRLPRIPRIRLGPLVLTFLVFTVFACAVLLTIGIIVLVIVEAAKVL